MAIVTFNFRSRMLGKATELRLVLPEISGNGLKPMCDYPVLTLLHGLTEDATAWLHHSSIERYATERQVCVVMPDGARSFWVNEVYGQRYYDFLSREVPMVLEKYFRLNPLRSKNAIAGLSMGGYGAMRHALTEPNRYCAVGSFSAPLDIIAWKKEAETLGGIQMYKGELDRIFGKDIAGTENDLLWLLNNTPEEVLPAMYVSCGDEDPTLSFQEPFVRFGEGTIEFRKVPGNHWWNVWDKEIEAFMDFACEKGWK